MNIALSISSLKKIGIALGILKGVIALGMVYKYDSIQDDKSSTYKKIYGWNDEGKD